MSSEISLTDANGEPLEAQPAAPEFAHQPSKNL
jgi:hypothetical protein